MSARAKSTIAILLISLGLSAVLFVKKGYMLSYPLLGMDQIKDVAILEDHRDALKHWVDKGIRKAVLVNVDAHDDIKRIPAADVEKGKNAYRRRTGTAGAENDTIQAGNNNFVYMAAKLGIVKKVVWVVPPSYGIFSDTGGRLSELLKMYGFPAEDAATFTMTGGVYRGTVDGVPVIICDTNSLPNIDQPILLTVDVDFFPALVTNESFLITKAVTETLASLFKKKYEVQDVTVAFSINGGYLSTTYRWVGHLVIDILREPAILADENLPQRYVFLQRADMLLLMKRYDELLHHLSPYIDQENIDPSVFIYAAQAHIGIGDRGNAFFWAEKACLAEKSYCYGLPELGNSLLDDFGIESAEPFFARGYGLCPDMDHGQFRFAMALKNAGRFDDAIKYFTIFRNCYGPFPVDFYIGETYAMEGNQTAALAAYDSGRREISRNPALLTGFGDFGAIEKAATYYESRGFASYAAELRDSLKTRKN